MKIKVKSNTEEKMGWDLKRIIGTIIVGIVFCYIIFLTVIFAFYFQDGYTQIASVKFILFRSVSLICGYILIPLSIFHAVLPDQKGKCRGQSFLQRTKIELKKTSWTDIFVLAYAVVNMMSYVASASKGEALWGASGWYMGLGTQLICVGIYFFVSRYQDFRLPVIGIILASSSILNIWALLNRFSIYPIEMTYSAPQFISSMGNVNWYSGYWSVFMAIGIVLYWKSKYIDERILYGFCSTIALALGVVEGSDSAYIPIFVVCLLLFLFSFRKEEDMKRFMEIMIMLTGACQVMRIIYIAAPQSLNMSDGVVSLMLGNVTLVLLIVFIIARILFQMAENKFYVKTRVEGEYLLKGWNWIRIAVIILLVFVFAGYIILGWMNTKHNGIIKVLSENSAFIFNGEWGNGRGTTWSDGFLIFGSLSFIQKLIGVGPDSFAAYGYAHSTISDILTSQFGSSRLTNAHNECITLLVNVGILGMVSFIGIIWSSAIRSIKKVSTSPMGYALGLCVLAYFWHNMFSFQQIENLPFIFLILGLGEAHLRTQD